MEYRTGGYSMKDQFIRGIQMKWENISPYSYVRSIPAVQNLQHLEFHKPITFFVGENGSGKSTLLEAIAIAEGFNPEGGTKNYSFSTYDSHSELYEAIRIIKGVRHAKWGYFLRAESFYNVATMEEEYARGTVPSERLHQISHGESFLAVAQKHFRPNGLYLLDEPEAALSPQRQLTLLMEIDRCVKEESQFIIVTHSPILLGMPNAEILTFDDEQIHPCDYEETDSYQVSEMFINHRAHLLRRLLENETDTM